MIGQTKMQEFHRQTKKRKSLIDSRQERFICVRGSFHKILIILSVSAVE